MNGKGATWSTPMLLAILPVCMAWFVGGCTGSSTAPDAVSGDPGFVDAGEDSPGTTDLRDLDFQGDSDVSPMDPGMDETIPDDPGHDGVAWDAADIREDAGLGHLCPDGLPRRIFQATDEQAALNALASDFQIPTTTGNWRLSDHWDGCQNIMIIQDRPRQNTGWPDTLWQYNVNRFLFRLPQSALVFFVSTLTDQGERQTALDALKGRVDKVLAGMSAVDAESLGHRIHYVPERAQDLPGWVGTLMKDPGWGLGVDRLQRVRFIGSYADWAQYDPDQQWFAPNLAMAANEPIHWDFEARRQAALDSLDATVVPVFTGQVIQDPGWAGERTHAVAELPDPEGMAAFDTLELDLTLGCGGKGEFGHCPAWDYLVHLYLCDVDDPDRCDVEIGRWVTTYHREGRWIHDVSPLLPLLASGGPRRLAFYSQQPYEVRLDLRLSNRAKEFRPSHARFLFGGGAFGPTYNDDREPVVVPIPADSGRVVLAVVVSGHGQVEPGNCAEFCTTPHHFTVNGTIYDIEFQEPGDPEGCLKQVPRGAVPNQYGTWWFGRNGWCPGMEVPMVVMDVTSSVTPGNDAVIDYRSLWNDGAYPSGGASLVLSSWLVIESP